MIKYIFSNYNDYLKKQVEKTKEVIADPKSFNEAFVNRFFERNKHLKNIKADGRVLCMGARTGVEVESFIKLGYDAIGIDLLECKPHVIAMDMMNIKFDYKFDIIYTNSIDHCYNIAKLAIQIGNNLVNDGIAVIDFNHSKRSGKVGNFESVSIGSSKDIIDIFCCNGFKFINNFTDLPKRYERRRMIEEQLIFKK